MNDDYKEKLVALCEGLEIQNIEKFLTLAPTQIKKVGSSFIGLINKLKEK